MSSSGAESDLRKATETAARMWRHTGHGERIGRCDVSSESGEYLLTDVEATNAPVEALLQAEHGRATRLLADHRAALLALVDELMAQGQVTPPRFAEVTGLTLDRPAEALDAYAQRLAEFRDAANAVARLRA